MPPSPKNDDLPIVHDGNKRHQAIEREVDLSDQSLLLLQNHTFCKATGAQMRGERKVDGLKRGQQPIFGFLEHANSAAMDVAGTPEIATKFHAIDPVPVGRYLVRRL